MDYLDKTHNGTEAVQELVEFNQIYKEESKKFLNGL